MLSTLGSLNIRRVEEHKGLFSLESDCKDLENNQTIQQTKHNLQEECGKFSLESICPLAVPTVCQQWHAIALCEGGILV